MCDTGVCLPPTEIREKTALVFDKTLDIFQSLQDTHYSAKVLRENELESNDKRSKEKERERDQVKREREGGRSRRANKDEKLRDFFIRFLFLPLCEFAFGNSNYPLCTFCRNEYLLLLLLLRKLKCIKWQCAMRRRHQRHVYGQTDFFSGKTWRQFKYDIFLLLFSYLTSSLEQLQEKNLSQRLPTTTTELPFSHIRWLCVYLRFYFYYF